MKKTVTFDYREERRKAYPPLAEQLDMLYHDPDGWREMVRSVKAKFPKEPNDAT